jgi:hypothetical protein
MGFVAQGIGFIGKFFVRYSFTFLLTLILGVSDASGYSRADLKKIFSRPLVIGASVSVGMFATGPGDIAALLVNGVVNTVNVAKNGAQGKSLGNVSAESLAKYSVIIGVDFFFWDSTEADPSESVRALKNLVRSARKAGIPLVLGDIPRLVSEQVEASRLRLNRGIRVECRRENRCFFLELDKLYRVARDSGLMIDERLYRFRELTIDGLHTNEFANGYLAKNIIRFLGEAEREHSVRFGFWQKN